ncbi:MAG: patatin-like phospholipase family protein [Pseudomonadota bacterium]|nr:patatin-like phospholipase family protein [Pseudomonadota bacterium]
MSRPPLALTPYRILSLDGGGAKGFYSLGVLREIEGLVGKPLHEAFDLVFGTSTGAIIGTLIALGLSVDQIHDLYKRYVPEIMRQRTPKAKSDALERLAHEVFGDATFSDVKTGIGIVATKWVIERPMIFKGSVAQAHGRIGTFVPGFGVPIRDAVQASCSAYPFFNRKTVETAAGDRIELVDGGYCANNPTLYAIADATRALNKQPEALRVVSIGVGNYPEPAKPFWSKMRWAKYLPSVQLLQKTLEVNTNSMDQLRSVLYSQVPTIRISNEYTKPEMATDLFECDPDKLNILRQRGVESFAEVENDLKKLLLE